MKHGTPLRSTALVYASYDDETETLEIDFVNGRSYTHVGVPQSVYDALAIAPSPGTFYNEQIKGQY